MKKLIVLILLLTNTFIFGQKNKKASKTKAEISNIIANTEDLVAEIIKGNLYTFRVDGKSKKDTLLLKNLTGTPLPTDCVIKKFTANQTPLYLITWKEISKIETNTKKEEVTNSCSQIWNPKQKLKVFDNEQKSTKIKEQVFLDKLKTASETQERTRNEGYTLTLLPNGDFTLKNKLVETKYVLNPTLMKFEVPVKVIPPVSTPKTTKKRK